MKCQTKVEKYLRWIINFVEKLAMIEKYQSCKKVLAMLRNVRKN